MAQDQRRERVKLEVTVVEDSVTWQKIIRHHLPQRGLENLVIAADGNMHQAIGGLKK